MTTTIDQIDFNTTPDRTNKTITLKVVPLITTIDDAVVGGSTYDFYIPLMINVYQRSIDAESGRKVDLTHLKDIENYLVEWFVMNRLSLVDDGISNLQIKNIYTFGEDRDVVKGEIWFRLAILVDIHYWMRAQIA